MRHWPGRGASAPVWDMHSGKLDGMPLHILYRISSGVSCSVLSVLLDVLGITLRQNDNVLGVTNKIDISPSRTKKGVAQVFKGIDFLYF